MKKGKYGAVQWQKKRDYSRNKNWRYRPKENLRRTVMCDDCEKKERNVALCSYKAQVLTYWCALSERKKEKPAKLKKKKRNRWGNIKRKIDQAANCERMDSEAWVRYKHKREKVGHWHNESSRDSWEKRRNLGRDLHADQPAYLPKRCKVQDRQGARAKRNRRSYFF